MSVTDPWLLAPDPWLLAPVPWLLTGIAWGGRLDYHPGDRPPFSANSFLIVGFTMSEATSASQAQPSSPPPAAESPPPESKSSPVRLAILLAILGVLIVALVIDTTVFPPKIEAAAQRLSAAHDVKSSQAVQLGKQNHLSREEVQKAIGFAPSSSEVVDGGLVEYYRWWAPLPLKRRFIEAEYDDAEGQRYRGFKVSNSLFGQDSDPEEDLQRHELPPIDPNAPTPPEGGAMPGPAGPPGPGRSGRPMGDVDADDAADGASNDTPDRRTPADDSSDDTPDESPRPADDGDDAGRDAGDDADSPNEA
jgi:hypothetical protein